MVRFTRFFILPAVFLACLFCFFACNKKTLYDPLETTIKLENARTDFSIFRNILEDAHPALTEYMTQEQKNALFDSLYASISTDITTRDFYKKLAFFLSKTGCSHTYASLPRSISDTLFNRKLFFPFPTILLDDALYINSDYQTDHGIKILSVNNIPVNRILDSLVIYNAVEGKPRMTQRHKSASDFGYDYYVHFPVPEKFEVLVKDTSGRIKTLFVDPITLEDLQSRNSGKYYYDATDVPYSLDINDDRHFAILRIPSFEFGSTNQQDGFESFLKNSFELLSKKKEIGNLIIDLRENGGGDLYNCFLLHAYIASHSFPEYKTVFSRVKKVPYEEYLYDEGDPIDVGHINKRLKNDFITKSPWGYNIPDSLISQWEPQPNHFTGNVYIITNHHVSSAASYFTFLSKNNARAKVVGTETSGGNYSGNGFRMLEYVLPATKIRFEFPYAKMIYSFSKAKTGRGVVPDYPLPDNYESFLKNKDCQLFYITDTLISKNR